MIVIKNYQDLNNGVLPDYTLPGDPEETFVVSYGRNDNSYNAISTACLYSILSLGPSPANSPPLKSNTILFESCKICPVTLSISSDVVPITPSGLIQVKFCYYLV